jgi:hypothetical protein
VNLQTLDLISGLSLKHRDILYSPLLLSKLSNRLV